MHGLIHTAPTQVVRLLLCLQRWTSFRRFGKATSKRDMVRRCGRRPKKLAFSQGCVLVAACFAQMSDGLFCLGRLFKLVVCKTTRNSLSSNSTRSAALLPCSPCGRERGSNEGQADAPRHVGQHPGCRQQSRGQPRPRSESSARHLGAFCISLLRSLHLRFGALWCLLCAIHGSARRMVQVKSRIVLSGASASHPLRVSSDG